MNKFKIGDKVVLQRNILDKEAEGMPAFFVPDMRDFVGQVGKVIDLNDDRDEFLIEGLGDYWYNGPYLELFEEPVVRKAHVKGKPKYQVGDRLSLLVGSCKPGMAVGFIWDMPKFEGISSIVTRVGEHKGVCWYYFGAEMGGYIYDEECFKRLRKAPGAVEKAQPIPMPPVPVEAAITKQKREEEELAVALKKLGDDLNKDVEMRGVGTCSYALLTDKLKQIPHYRDACHARIPVYVNGKGVDEVLGLALNIRGHLVEAEQPAAYEEFVEYILKESPWKTSFVAGQSFASGVANGLFMDVEKPIAQVASAAIALRQASEFPNELKVFAEIKKMGFSGNVANLLMNSLFIKGGSFSYSLISNGHRVLCPSMDYEELFKFYSEGFKGQAGDKPYRTCNERYGILKRVIANSPEEGGKQISTHMESLLGISKRGMWDDVPAKDLPIRSIYKAAEALSLLVNSKEMK